MKESAHKNLRDSEYLFFRIGNIIQEMFVKQKAPEYYNLIRIYQMIVSNINWVLQPKIEKKEKTDVPSMYGMQFVRSRILQRFLF